MNPLVDGAIDASLWFLAGWSVRWGVLIIVLASWFRLRPPGRASTRHLLCATATAAGLILPLSPRWPGPGPRAAASFDRDPHPVAARPRPPVVPGGSRPAGPTPAGAAGPARVGRPASGPGTSAWLRVVLAASWLTGAGVVLARLVVARVILARLRGEARPVDGEDLERCRREMGSSRAVALAAHPAVGSPILLGGRSPMILVPDDWEGLPRTDRRACLLHELAHLDRRDDLTRLAAELARAPFWFHPAVAWLLGRLDREAELACDEAAVGRGVAPRELAGLLLAFARRPRRSDPRDSSFGRLAPPFFTRGTVAIRIHRLLEDDMPRTLIPAPKHATLGLAAALAAIALAIGGAGARSVDPASQRPAPAPEPAARRSSWR